jgi:putative tryptophan/tyrosine transport system substrate-binding protein
MQRREFIAFLGGVAVFSPGSAGAQTPGTLYRIAVVSPGGLVAESSPNGKLLLGALARLGYVVGQNLAFEAPRSASAPPIRLPQLMEELKASKVDLIVA